MQHSNKNNLLQNKIIKKSIAGLLLLLFAFSITPKKILHDLIANHKDTISKFPSANGKSQHINKATIYCHCEDLVAESPFTDPSVLIEILKPVVFSDQPVLRIFNFHSQHQLFFELRGPPAFS